MAFTMSLSVNIPIVGEKFGQARPRAKGRTQRDFTHFLKTMKAYFDAYYSQAVLIGSLSEIDYIWLYLNFS